MNIIEYFLSSYNVSKLIYEHEADQSLQYSKIVFMS